MIAIAKCGIEKYDELPGRVALIDVNSHRYTLKHLRNDRLRDKLVRVWMPLIYHRLSTAAIEQKAIDDLEEARKIHHGEIEPSWTRFFRRFKSKFEFETGEEGDS